jgi:coenzyme F420 hydrogenase subunit beta
MISGLATGTPTLVIGWSHKYAEVMGQFGQEELVLGYRDLRADRVAELLADLVARRQAISSTILSHLPIVTNESRRSLEELAKAANPTLPASSPYIDRPFDLSPVIGSDMCIACGACVHADPTISLQLDPVKQIYEPSHPGNKLAAEVCPAIAVDYGGLQDRIFPGSQQTPYGVVESVMLAQSVDHERNINASSGGLIKELLMELLSRPDVDGAIVLSAVAGLDFVPKLITDPTQVDELPGSIYHNLPKDEVLTLLKESEGRLVLVGIPCEFEGIFQYIYTAAPELEAKIASTIGLLCGWQYSHHAIRAIAEYKGFQFDDIESISYRGGGPVGKLRVQTPEGEFSASRRIDFGYQVAFDRTFNTPRCHLCINHSNFLADIVVGDAWLPSTVGTRTGISLIINRTKDAHDLMTKLQDTGRVIATGVTVEEIKESQKPRVVFGDFAYAYADYRRQIGLHTPRLDGPNKNVATHISQKEVAAFHKELVVKLGLQRSRRYRRLYWRKATKELPRFIGRYWEWFSVRILRIKSIRGERQELTRDQLSRFK